MLNDPYGIVPIVEPVIVGMGYNFWGMECQASENTAQVRIFIDHSEGITLDDCSRVSQQLSAVLDVEDPVQVPYTLEISSPGINRKLFSAEQMKDAIGSKVKVKTTWPINERRNIRGVLKDANDEQLTVVTQEGDEFIVPIEAIKNAKLDLDIDPNLKAKN
ncbi:MAG: ribosome maturation factor RimP [Gammaproteobacteria bacterium]|nr:ribosome maturation factor RimP [Gammaproteobacteria bacterium]